MPDRVKLLPIATSCPLAGFVIFTPSDVSSCGSALTEEIQMVDAKRIMIIANNTNFFSDLMLKVLMYLTGGHHISHINSIYTAIYKNGWFNNVTNFMGITYIICLELVLLYLAKNKAEV